VERLDGVPAIRKKSYRAIQLDGRRGAPNDGRRRLAEESRANVSVHFFRVASQRTWCREGELLGLGRKRRTLRPKTLDVVHLLLLAERVLRQDLGPPDGQETIHFGPI
jgi:hypothetical protein